uniref:DDE Tnp4 domain-containing protein n=1 Tax=Erpetoichthys calabaricus TaxID=27687 RepID=A0A8C4TAU6_ERPCA
MHIDPVGAAIRFAVTLGHLATGISLRVLAASYKLGFWNFWNFPNCLGAIDGKHVRVCAPCHTGSAFFNYKEYFSFILMAVCDARYRFTVVDIGAYGRDSGGVFVRSQFGSQLIQGNLFLLPPSTLPGSEVLSPHVFIADEAFPLKDNLIRPYSGTNLTPKQRIYNYWHSRARWVVENAFGILAARWRIFGKAMECSVDRAQDITKAYSTFVYPITSALVTVWIDGDLTNPGRLTASQATRTGTLVHDCLKEYFQTVAGKVTFQDAALHRGSVN